MVEIVDTFLKEDLHTALQEAWNMQERHLRVKKDDIDALPSRPRW